MRRFIKPALITVGAASAVFLVTNSGAAFNAAPAAKAKTFCHSEMPPPPPPPTQGSAGPTAKVGKAKAGIPPIGIPPVVLPSIPPPSIPTPNIPCIPVPNVSIPTPNVSLPEPVVVKIPVPCTAPDHDADASTVIFETTCLQLPTVSIPPVSIPSLDDLFPTPPPSAPSQSASR